MIRKLKIATICALLGGSITFFVKSNLESEIGEALELGLVVFSITFVIFFVFARK
ncbi:MAG: hypothetical protein WC461_03400 [Candidatus Paceibacterota bacterium]